MNLPLVEVYRINPKDWRCSVPKKHQFDFWCFHRFGFAVRLWYWEMCVQMREKEARHAA